MSSMPSSKGMSPSGLSICGRSSGIGAPGLGWQRFVARPLVPRAGVVAGVVAGGAEDLHGQRGARAGVAVGDDLRSGGQLEPLLDLRRGQLHQLLEVEVACSRDPALPRIAVRTELARVLLFGAHVENRQRLVAEPPRELLAVDVAHRSIRTAPGSSGASLQACSAPSMPIAE